MIEYKLKAAPTAVSKGQNSEKQPKANRILIGVDVHLKSYQAAHKLDNGAVGVAQSFGSKEALLLYVEKQRELAKEVVVLYEAGPLGYKLYRELKASAIECVVCAPRSGEQKRKRRKNNAIDARTLSSDGSWSNWWRPKAFERLSKEVASWIVKHLGRWVGVLRELDQQIQQAKVELSQKWQGPRPKGMGAVSLVQLMAEVLDWNLYSSRRKIGCLAGMVPSEWSTGESQRLGSITKVGLPALRRILTEMVWRMILFQPNYKAVQKWRELLEGPNRGLKKKAVVAIGRQLMVDIWRLQTGRISAQELGLIMIEG
jgi:transposase